MLLGLLDDLLLDELGEEELVSLTNVLLLEDSLEPEDSEEDSLLWLLGLLRELSEDFEEVLLVSLTKVLLLEELDELEEAEDFEEVLLDSLMNVLLLLNEDSDNELVEDDLLLKLLADEDSLLWELGLLGLLKLLVDDDPLLREL